MKITKREVAVTVSFETLDCGAVFRDADSIYMVIEEIDEYNAVDLNDGHIVHFMEYDRVTELDKAELVY